MADTATHNTAEAKKLPERWTGEMRALLVLGVPMALTQLAQFFVYTIDVLMIGKLGPEDLAAASLGTVIYFALWMLGSGAALAVTPLVSQALGANQNDYQDVRRSVRMALWVIFLMFPAGFILLCFAEPIMLAFGQDAVLSQKAGDYVLALSVGWPFALSIMALRNFLAALGKTKVPLLLIIATTGFNAVFNYLLIYGSFGFPKWGLVGAGVASSVSYILSFAMFVVYIKLDRQARQFDLFTRLWKSDWARFREVIALGWPMSVTTFFEGMLFNATVLLMGLIGILEVAAYQVAINIVALAFMLPWGLSMAGAVRIGLAAGAGNSRAVKRASLTTLSACVIGMAFIAAPVVLIPGDIARLYLDASDPENSKVIDLIVLFLPIAAAFMLFDAAQVGANQLLRGLKDVRWPMVITGISYWAVGFPIAVYLGDVDRLGAVGVWYGLTAGLIVVSILLGGRLFQIVWRQPKIKGFDL